jgi:hypothetical protein
MSVPEPITESFAAELAETDPASTTAAEPIAVKVTRYRCPFCPRGWSRKSAAAVHVARCWNNPAVGNCKTCANFEREEEACGCKPGCNWGNNDQPIPEDCAAGVDISEGLRSGCPLWRLREDS